MGKDQAKTQIDKADLESPLTIINHWQRENGG
jgi:hypothetical protein